ncbi:hypothetical protein BD311DRAFT_764566 [Dichomitus squalens]|uniref:Uncharacterized protein n=1 Tax=Dichomitus squalens TaxID=114155 RepID=A0A4Q9MHP0_9APHY|nr:hypothetical protein BD311DRAFT_764566 [Dichomitus squalens]
MECAASNSEGKFEIPIRLSYIPPPSAPLSYFDEPDVCHTKLVKSTGMRYSKALGKTLAPYLKDHHHKTRLGSRINRMNVSTQTSSQVMLGRVLLLVFCASIFLIGVGSMFSLLRRSSTSSLRTSSSAASARIRTASCCLRCVSIRIRVSSLFLCRRSCCTMYAVLTSSRVVHCKYTVSPLRGKSLRSVLWLCTVLCAPASRLSRRARAT